jgi:hypothetical protein
MAASLDEVVLAGEVSLQEIREEESVGGADIRWMFHRGNQALQQRSDLGVLSGAEEDREVGDWLAEVRGEDLVDRAWGGQVEAARTYRPRRGAVPEATVARDEVMELELAPAMGMPPPMPGDLSLILKMIDEDNIVEAQRAPLPPYSEIRV